MTVTEYTACGQQMSMKTEDNKQRDALMETRPSRRSLLLCSYPTDEYSSGSGQEESSGYSNGYSSESSGYVADAIERALEDTERTLSQRSKRDNEEASGESRSGEENSGVDSSTTVTTDETTTVVAATDNTTAKAVCKGSDVCFGDADCNGGRCIGAFVEKCNCNACLNFWKCSDDSACGGLSGACNKTTTMCDCFEGYKVNGFPLYIDALRDLCNTKTCTKENSAAECFDLPCNSGRCFC